VAESLGKISSRFLFGVRLCTLSVCKLALRKTNEVGNTNEEGENDDLLGEVGKELSEASI
jgi:hypothetical protein